MNIRVVALALCLSTSQLLNAQTAEPTPAPEVEAPEVAVEVPVPTPAGGLQDSVAGAETPQDSRVQLRGTAVRPGMNRGVATNADETAPFTVFSSTTPQVPLFYVGSDGRVGIGTTSPQYPLDILRDAGSSSVRLGSSVPASFSSIRFTEGAADKAHISSINSTLTSAVGGANALQLWNYSDAPIIFGTNQVERMRIFGNGNVAIGTTASSAAALYVNQSAAGVGFAIYALSTDNIAANVTQNDYGMYLTAAETVASGFKNSGTLFGSRGLAQVSGAGTIAGLYGLRTEASIATDSTAVVETAIGHYVLVGSGNAGTINTGYGLYLPNVSAVNDYAIYQLGADDSNYFAGNVAIGAISAAAKLYVHDTAQLPRIVLAGTEYFQPLNTTQPTSGIGLYLGVNRASNRQLWIGDTNSTTAPFLRISPSGASPVIDAISHDGVTPVTLTLGTNANVAMATVSGNVGIGTTTPAYKLHVNGNAHFEGTVTGRVIHATYQDVAEWVPATTDLEPGTVVVLNKTRNNEVMASATPYDTRVAGVVSAQPGLSLGVEGEGKEQIATYGRVKVKVDATKAPIEVGDLLVTSAISGTAMRSEPMDINGRSFHQPGTIIGKALEPLAGGVGEILVLLSLQ